MMNKIKTYEVQRHSSKPDQSAEISFGACRCADPQVPNCRYSDVADGGRLADLPGQLSTGSLS